MKNEIGSAQAIANAVGKKELEHGLGWLIKALDVRVSAG
jgi:hypothetical protein